MPYTKRTVRTLARNGVKKAAKKARRKYVNRQIGILGANPRVSFRYVDTISPTPTIFGVYSFMVNSLYDPNYSGTGHQPSGFDALATLYKHYIVLKAVVTVRALNTSTTVPAYIGGAFSRLTLDGDLDGSNPVVNFEEQSSAKTFILGVQGSGTEVKTFKMSVIPHKFMGMNQPIADDRFWGENSANPSEQVYWNLFTCSVNQASNPTVTYSVKTEFFTMWREPLRRAVN